MIIITRARGCFIATTSWPSRSKFRIAAVIVFRLRVPVKLPSAGWIWMVYEGTRLMTVIYKLRVQCSLTFKWNKKSNFHQDMTTGYGIICTQKKHQKRPTFLFCEVCLDLAGLPGLLWNMFVWLSLVEYQQINQTKSILHQAVSPRIINCSNTPSRVTGRRRKWRWRRR